MIRLLSSLAVALSLQPFFEYFRGTPHQLAAIKELEDSMPPELLAEDAAWFEAWKESGIAQRAYVPYFHQLSLDKGYRRCFDASAAMVAALHGAVQTAEEYGAVREKFGDTIEVSAQLDALRKLGLNAEFRTDGDEAVLEAEVASGRPVLVGWLHRGDLSRGEPPMCNERGCGHWSVIVGYTKESFVIHDPMGTPNLLYGGHDATTGGKNIEVSRKLFRERWMVEGEKSGWLILVDDE